MSSMTFLGVMGEVLVEGDAHKDRDADEHYHHPQVEEVHEGSRGSRGGEPEERES